MEPTIHCARPDPGCRGEEKDVIVVKTSGLESFERGDIVVHRAPPAAAEACGVDAGSFVKRVIGLPGERITIARTETEVDGEPLAEPYATRDQVTTSRDWIVPAGAYFLVGDNRPASCDSRHLRRRTSRRDYRQGRRHRTRLREDRARLTRAP